MKVLIRGLKNETSIEEIGEELKAKKFDFKNIQQLKKGNGDHYRRLPLFPIILPVNTNNKEIYKLNELLNANIKFANYFTEADSKFNALNAKALDIPRKTAPVKQPARNAQKSTSHINVKSQEIHRQPVLIAKAHTPQILLDAKPDQSEIKQIVKK